jgi:hypothetical protein
MGAAALDKCVPVPEGMVSMEAASEKGVVTAINLATSPCGNCPHKNVWVAMMIKSGDDSGTHKAEWEEMMLMPGHGSNRSLTTCNDARKAGNWPQREHHIYAQGVTSSVALSLDMRRRTSISIGSNTVTNNALSPPARLYYHAAAH